MNGSKMSPELPNKKVIIIVGPTAVGKTGISIQLAKQIDGEIVSADSRYLYRGMNIGTAKPTLQEMDGVVHHMVDIADPGETWSLAQYFEKSKQAIAGIISRKHTPIVVGGTGQYFRALTQGWLLPGSEPNFELRDRLEEWGQQIGFEELHRKLGIIDPEATLFIQPENMRRTIRALEVIFTNGKKFSSLRTKTEPDHVYHVIGLTMPREKLYSRVDERIQQMFDQGLIEEVKDLKQKGYDTENPAMSAIGYIEVLQYLDGRLSLNEAVMLMKRKTRQFIRRQANWFKPSDPQIHWYEMEENVLERIISDLITSSK